MPVDTDKRVRIVAALVNPVGPDESLETVMLVNTTSAPVSLDGWKLTNQESQSHALQGSVDANLPLLVRLPASFQLPNEGGAITLLNDQGVEVDGVTYTAAQAGEEGRTIVF
jgi:hypothetical protein